MAQIFFRPVKDGEAKSTGLAALSNFGLVYYVGAILLCFGLTVFGAYFTFSTWKTNGVNAEVIFAGLITCACFIKFLRTFKPMENTSATLNSKTRFHFNTDGMTEEEVLKTREIVRQKTIELSKKYNTDNIHDRRIELELAGFIKQLDKKKV